MTDALRTGVLDVGNVLMGAKPQLDPQEAQPSIWRSEQVSFDSLPGETSYVLGYSG